MNHPKNAITYPYVLLDNHVKGVVIRSTGLTPDPVHSDFPARFEAMIEMAIPGGFVTAVRSCPLGPWIDHEGFLEEELEGLADYLDRKYVDIYFKLSEPRKE